MRKIIKIEKAIIKEFYSNKVLRALPEWFGEEDGILNYVNSSRESLFFISELHENVEGFISVYIHNEHSAEILSMGVLKDFQHRGVGRELVREVEVRLSKLGIKLLQVKTLGATVECEYYSRTRDFYETNGFYKLEENHSIWGVRNPCLIMVKPI